MGLAVVVVHMVWLFLGLGLIRTMNNYKKYVRRSYLFIARSGNFQWKLFYKMSRSGARDVVASRAGGTWCYGAFIGQRLVSVTPLVYGD